MILVGFMACGKTTVGKILASKMERRWIELDSLIEEASGESPADIITRRGEAVFRELEYRILRTCAGHDFVISAGGGAFIPEDTRRFLRDADFFSVYLDLPWKVLQARAEAQEVDRPLWKDAFRAEELFLRRRPVYRQADLVLGLTGNESPGEVAELILSEFGERA